MQIPDDERWMQAALREAEKAQEAGEVPVGAVVVHQGKLIGRGYNRIEALQDATAHAEIIAIGAASASLGTWRLNDCILYVTLEPCLMCAGAIRLSRISRLVYGAPDPTAGVFGSQLEVRDKGFVQVEVTAGVREAESRKMLQSFFKKIRSQQP